MKMKIALISLGTKNIADIRDIGFSNKKQYCNKYGYDFIGYDAVLDTSRPASWSKILAIQEHIDKYDWIMWIDADAAIINNNIKVEDIVDNNFELLLSKDEVNINMGVFFLKSCAWSKFFLNVVYSLDRYVDDTFWEQAAVISLLPNNGYIKHFKFINKCIINSYPNDVNEKSMVIHCPGRYKRYLKPIFNDINVGCYDFKKWRRMLWKDFTDSNTFNNRPWYFGLEGNWWHGLNEEQFLERVVNDIKPS
jgi:hypothetical protein